MEAELLIETKNNVRHLIINRPHKRNSLNRALIAALTAAFQTKDSDFGAFMLYGAGIEAFSAGADLSELQAANTPEARLLFFQELAALLGAMRNNTRPIITKVHGYALAGGCGLAASGDIVLAADDAEFGLPELKLAMVPMVVLAPLSRVIGQRALSAMTLSADSISAIRAKEFGLVTEILPKAKLDAEAIALTERIAAYSPLALRVAKRGLNDAQELGFDELLKELPRRIAEHSLSSDVREGIDAFLNKRKAVWTGK
jgi:enoyl-CoA hydratase/carnithine racemase